MVEFVVEDGIARIRLNRPEKINAVDDRMAATLVDLMRRCRKDPSLAAVWLEGEGGKGFCSGADVKFMEKCGYAELHDYFRTLADLILEMRSLPVPVVSFLHGYTLGLGGAFVALSDRAVAADDVKIGFPEIRGGIFPLLVFAPLLEAIPRRAAVELLLSGRTLSGTEARAMGLVHEVVPAAKLEERKAEITAEIRAGRIGYRYVKRGVRALDPEDPPKTMERLVDLMVDNFRACSEEKHREVSRDGA